MKPALVLIAAVARNGVIGRDNRLLWRLRTDLQRFKALTLGKPVLMGRKTAESLRRALPGRLNLVLTRSGRVPHAGMQAVASLAEALARAAGAELMVIGGGEVYALALPLADRLELTEGDTRLPSADARFPPWRTADWRETRREAHAADGRHAHAFTFLGCDRILG